MNRVVGAALAALALVVAYNAAIALPAAVALGEDDRNAGFTTVAYRSYAIAPQSITIDLWSTDRAAPIDLYRGLFQVAKALKDRHFQAVTLAHKGLPIFELSGEDFGEIGREFAGGENPVYMIRTLPENLRRMDGSSAYGEWSGGVLGVLSHQLSDVTDAAHTWAGLPPSPPDTETAP